MTRWVKSCCVFSVQPWIAHWPAPVPSLYVLSLLSVAVNLGLPDWLRGNLRGTGVPTIFVSFDSGMVVVGVGALGLVLWEGSSWVAYVVPLPLTSVSSEQLSGMLGKGGSAGLNFPQRLLDFGLPQVKLVQHTYSCLFGTFLCNNAKERGEKHTQERTCSVWSLLRAGNKAFKNLLYSSQSEAVCILQPFLSDQKGFGDGGMWESFSVVTISSKASLLSMGGLVPLFSPLSLERLVSWCSSDCCWFDLIHISALPLQTRIFTGTSVRAYLSPSMF